MASYKGPLHGDKKDKQQTSNRFDCLDTSPRSRPTIMSSATKSTLNNSRRWRPEEESASGPWASKARRERPKRADAVEHELLADLCERTVVFCNIPIGSTRKEQELIKNIFCGAVKAHCGLKWTSKYITADDLAGSNGEFMVTLQTAGMVNTLMIQQRGSIPLYASVSGKGKSGMARGTMMSTSYRRKSYGSVTVRRLNTPTQFAQPWRQRLWNRIECELTPIVRYLIDGFFHETDPRAYIPIGELFSGGAGDVIKQHAKELQALTGVRSITSVLTRAADIIEGEHGLCIAIQTRPKGEVIVIDAERQRGNPLRRAQRNPLRRALSPRVAAPATTAPIIAPSSQPKDSWSKPVGDWADVASDASTDIASSFASMNLTMLPGVLPHDEQPVKRAPPMPHVTRSTASPSMAEVPGNSNTDARMGETTSMGSAYWHRTKDTCKFWDGTMGSCPHARCNYVHLGQEQTQQPGCQVSTPSPARTEKPSPRSTRFDCLVEAPAKQAWKPSGRYRSPTPVPSPMQRPRGDRYARYAPTSSWSSPPQSQEIEAMPAIPFDHYQSQPGSSYAESLTQEGQVQSQPAPSTTAPDNSWEDVPLAQWTRHHVGAWIRSLAANIAKYATTFEENDVDGQFLLDITAEDIEDLVNDEVSGYKRLHRRVILGKIKRLRNSHSREGQENATGC